MKIARIDAYAKRYTLAKSEYAWSGGNAIRGLDTLIVKVTSDEGLVGFGESCPLGPAYLPAFAGGAYAAAREIAPALLGLDPRDVRVVNTRMDQALLGHPYAKSPFDEACWDILGKASGQSVATLLGGRYCEDYPLYMAISQGPAEAMADETAERREQGYRQFQLKVGGDPDEDVARIKAVLGVTDPGDAVICDANTGWTMRGAARLARGIEALDVYLEQPCKTYEECLFIRQRTTLPFVLDEVMIDVQALLRAYHDRAMEIINLKISRFGGLTRAKQVRDLCETLGISMTIEDAMGGDIVTASVAHLVGSTRPEYVFSTTCMNSWVTDRFAADAPEARNGRTWVPSGPGLGIEVDESWLGEPLFTAR
jgi:L-alanine-DL-glutamate epimerase-like enolase superfamily enzyme